MVSNLLELSENPATKEAIVKDAQALVESELAGKSGISAGAVKLAYKAVTSFAPGYYVETLNIMVPSMLEQLQPFWTDYQVAGGGSFGEYLVKRQDEVTPALLLVTDDMANASEKAVVVKAYKTVRGGAAKHIEAALPALGGLVEKYAA